MIDERQAADREAHERQTASTRGWYWTRRNRTGLNGGWQPATMPFARRGAALGGHECRRGPIRRASKRNRGRGWGKPPQLATLSSGGSLDEAKQTWTSELAAAADRLAAREAELMNAIALSTAMSEGLEVRLAERDGQLKEQAASHAAAQDALQTRTSNQSHS